MRAGFPDEDRLRGDSLSGWGSATDRASTKWASATRTRVSTSLMAFVGLTAPFYGDLSTDGSCLLHGSVSQVAHVPGAGLVEQVRGVLAAGGGHGSVEVVVSSAGR